MNAAIVDTDVGSMLFKGDTRALGYRPHIAGRLLGISFMTLAELERWPLERDWGERRKLELTQHLTRYVVLPVTGSCVASGPRFRSPRGEKAARSKPATPGSQRVPSTIKSLSLPTIEAIIP